MASLTRALPLIVIAWLSAVACGGLVAPPTCPPRPAGLCPPTAGCAHGALRTGDALCVDGTWECVEEGCDGVPACAKGAIFAIDFDQSCATDDDCIEIYEGPRCGGCYCENGAAVGRGGFVAYNEAASTLDGPSTCDCIAIVPPQCVAGRCQ